MVDKDNQRLQQREQKFEMMSQDELFKPDNWFSDYHKAPEIKQWYQKLAADYPDLVTFIPSIGKTVLGEDIFALYVGSDVDRDTKPQFWYHTGGPATVQYFIHHLITNYGKEKISTSLLDRSELIVVPLMNIDGYSYTWTPAGRLWRKNRRVNKDGFFGSIG
ncbi:hypothetical protein HDU76_012183, partial [Blyttiomyces sp. JEL0837]